jgi:competence protein ComGC
VGTSYFYSIVYLVVVMVIATVLILTIPETGRGKKAVY